MPIIFTRGGLSARGAGTFSLVPAPPPSPPTPGPPPPPPPPGPPPPVVQTVVFTSSGSWTAPSGVSSISSINIAGGAFTTTQGQFVYTTNIAAVLSQLVSGSPGPTSVVAPTTYAQAGSYADNRLSEFNSGGTGEREVGYSQLFLAENPSLSPANRYWQDFTFVPSLIIRGVASRAVGPWDNRSSQIANGIGSGWTIGVDVYYPPTPQDGTPSSAFGFSAPGGTQADPQPSTFVSSVAVTPGQTYTITVGSPSGQVNFQFTQG